MQHLVLPSLFALFVWWFSTGLILYLDGLPKWTFRWSMTGATVLMIVSSWGLARSSTDTSVTGVYVAFACAMLAWGWHEISFYTGYVTGPRPFEAPQGARGWQRFGYALGCSLYHELAIIVSASVVVWSTWGNPNQVGTWTFMVMWAMHESARVNVFLGVPNVSEEFLPEHMRFLRSFMTRKTMNLLFPLSVTVGTVVGALFVQRALATDAPPTVMAGYTFLATMMAIATLEHWFLVVPLPTRALWEWGMKSRAARTPFVTAPGLIERRRP